MTADLYKKAARKSAMLGISLNQLVQRAVEKEVREPGPWKNAKTRRYLA